jgi:hypothetical protein
VNISYGNESEDDVKVKRKIVLEGWNGTVMW